MTSYPIKICFIDFFAYSLFNPRSKIVFGGAQIQLYFLAKKLANSKQFQVSFLTDDQRSDQSESFKSIKVVKLLRSTVNSPTDLVFRLFKKLKQINAHFYVQRAASAETGLIAIIAKLLGKNFIFMVAHEHGVSGQYIATHGFKGRLFQIGLHLADKIICQTQQQKKLLPQNLQNKTMVISSGYPLYPSTKKPKKYLLWVARAEDWKQPEIFIHLAKKIPQEKFIMICPPSENNPQYFKLVKSLAKKVHNLKFITHVPFDQIDRYFQSAKLFISTSLSEGFPNTFIQSAKNSVPIVSFQVNPDHLFDKHHIGLCCHGDQKKLLKFTQRLLTNKQQYQRLADNAYHYAYQFHNLDQTASAFKRIVLSMLSSSNPT